MFGLFRQFSGYADEARSLRLHGGGRGSMLGSYSGGVLRLNLSRNALMSSQISRSGNFSMIPLQVLSTKIRSSKEETFFMASKVIPAGIPPVRRERA